MKTCTDPSILQAAGDTRADPAPVDHHLHGHLSYPDGYDVMVDIPQVGRIKIRPFFPNDAALWEALFKSLTPRSIYLRFFCFMKQLPASMLEQMTCIDHSFDIALVALLQQEDKETMIGDARVIAMLDSQSAEFSVLVTDHYQGKGIGACLLSHCLDIARRRRIKHIFGMVLTDNIQMLALGKKLGFKVTFCPGSREYELSKTFEDDE